MFASQSPVVAATSSHGTPGSSFAASEAATPRSRACARVKPRSPRAMTVHAPHPGVKFLVWRAWTGGKDRDYLVFQEYTHSRVGRAAMTAGFAAKKIGRAWQRIVTKGGKVDLPLWQRPAAMALVMAMTGRTPGLDDLAGDGLATLRRRMTSSG